MNLVGRLIREHIRPHLKALAVRFLIAAAVAATPYAFSFLGKWLVDEALQVTGRKGFNHNISRLGQPLEDFPPILLFDVERNTPLVGAIGKPIEAFLQLGDIAIKRAESAGRNATWDPASGLWPR